MRTYLQVEILHSDENGTSKTHFYHRQKHPVCPQTVVINRSICYQYHFDPLMTIYRNDEYINQDKISLNVYEN